MVGVAVGWELYERTQSAMSLAWAGLAQALPIILLALPAGHAADRHHRRLVVFISQLILSLCSAGLGWISLRGGSVDWMYALLLAGSVAQAFKGAASAALLPQTVPASEFSNAITWKSSSFQIASVAGPALGGAMIAALGGAAGVYLADALVGLIYAGCAVAMRTPRPPAPREEVNWRTLLAGVHFVWRTKVLLATLSLDLFAVIVSGATALLPIYASDILHVGPTGLGWLRAAPAIGAFLMATWIAHRPPMKRCGWAMLWAVAGYGVATVVFGHSISFGLSLVMLGLTGALDNISVVVRHSLVQLLTPDAMRGRVSAVNNVFISASNELGAFRAGLTAEWFGAVGSVVIGGYGAIAIVLLTALLWPQVRRLGSLSDVRPEPV